MTDPQPNRSATELQGIARFRFHDGQVEEFKRLSAICMEIVQTQDTGTLQYDTYFNADESECLVLERYRDVAALLEHGTHIGDEMMAAILQTADVHGELLGPIPAELQAELAGGPVQHFSLYRSL